MRHGRYRGSAARTAAATRTSSAALTIPSGQPGSRGSFFRSGWTDTAGRTPRRAAPAEHLRAPGLRRRWQRDTGRGQRFTFGLSWIHTQVQLIQTTPHHRLRPILDETGTGVTRMLHVFRRKSVLLNTNPSHRFAGRGATKLRAKGARPAQARRHRCREEEEAEHHEPVSIPHVRSFSFPEAEIAAQHILLK